MRLHRSIISAATILLSACVVILLLAVLAFSSAAHAQGSDARQQATAPDYLADAVVVETEPNIANAIARLETGDLGIYAGTTSSAIISSQIAASPNLDAYVSFGIFDDLIFNPSVFSDTDRLNPFAVPRVREAMNYLIDRDYIAQEIFGGMAVPRWHVLNTASSDYVALASVARGLELEYAYDKTRAQQIVFEEMDGLGATMVDGAWQYNDEPVEIILLIRTEDERLAIGNYVGDQLEDLGFTTVRDERPANEANPIWTQADPAEGLFHIYTGAWMGDKVPRDLGGNFAYFYTDIVLNWPLWQAYTNTVEFYDLARRLNENDFDTRQERNDAMAEALPLALENSAHLWLVDRLSLTPRQAEVSYASDLYGGIASSWLWPQTLTQEGVPTPTITIGSPELFQQPWNPLNGSTWAYDRMIHHATADAGTVPDPYTGLAWPQRIEHVDVVVQSGLPVSVTLDWVNLSFAPEIEVPDDAWVGWDAVDQRFLTAAEVYTETETARHKVVVYYPEDLYTSVTWHDGSPFSIADVVLNMILAFDRFDEASAVYDPSLVDLMASFKGMRILSADPLIIEHYDDHFELDAELGLHTWWPTYGAGPGAWHNVTLGLMAEAAGEAAFSQSKADEEEVPWLDYVDEPSLSILANMLATAQLSATIPYTPTLDQYITPAQATERWNNLADWYADHEHFWLGTGPLYLEQVLVGVDELTLTSNPVYPDAPDRWDEFTEAPIPEVVVSGPDNIVRGEEAVYTIEVTLNGQPYPNADIEAVRYLVLGADGEVRLTGDAIPVGGSSDAAIAAAIMLEDGLWRVVLDAQTTNLLPGGTNRLEIVVTSERVVIPVFSAQLFTLPHELFLSLVVRP